MNKHSEEFKQLLEENVEEALTYRLSELEHSASRYKTEVNLSHGVPLVAMSFSYAAGPLGALCGGVALTVYFTSVLLDKMHTGSIYPIPGFRKTLPELIMKIGGVSFKEDTLDEYLSRDEALEYSILVTEEDNLIRFLSSLFPTERILNYERLIRSYKLGRKPLVKTPEQSNVITLMPSKPKLSASKTEPSENSPTPPSPKNEEKPITVAYEPIKPVLDPDDIPTVIEAPQPVESEPETTEESLWSRMDSVLNRMGEEGFHLKRLLKKPLIVCNGPSQSGKSTIAHMVAIARLAYGLKVEYISPDTDFPDVGYTKIRGNDGTKPLWTEIHNTYAEITNKIANSAKGALNCGFTFDEVWKVAQQGVNTNPLYNETLQKGDKTKALVTIITQSFTLKSIGGEGIREAFDDSACLIEPIFHEDEFGERYPSGEYSVSYNRRTEKWRIPSWLLTEKNKYGQICPATTLLKMFPELKLGAEEPKTVLTKVSTAGKGFAKPVEPRWTFREPYTKDMVLRLLADDIERNTGKMEIISRYWGVAKAGKRYQEIISKEYDYLLMELGVKEKLEVA